MSAPSLAELLYDLAGSRPLDLMDGFPRGAVLDTVTGRDGTPRFFVAGRDGRRLSCFFRAGGTPRKLCRHRRGTARAMGPSEPTDCPQAGTLCGAK